MVKLLHFEPEIKKNTIWFFRQKNSSVLEPCVSPWPYLIFTCSAVILWKLYLSISWVSKDFLSFRICSKNFRVFPIISVFPRNLRKIFSLFFAFSISRKLKQNFTKRKENFRIFCEQTKCEKCEIFVKRFFLFAAIPGPKFLCCVGLLYCKQYCSVEIQQNS